MFFSKKDESDIMTLSDTPIIFVCHASCCLGVLNHHPKPLKEQIVCPLSGRERALARSIIEDTTSRSLG